MIKRKELETAYWGPNRIPPEWKSVDQIAEVFGVDSDYVVRALEGYGIPIRTPKVDAGKFIWEVLEKAFRMVPKSHFLYQTEMNRSPVDFYIIAESIGIIVEPALPVWEVKTLHIGNSMVIKIGCSKPEENARNLERQLRDLGVRTRYIREIEEDNGDW